MIVGIGTDIVAVENVRREMERSAGFAATVFAPEEVAAGAQVADPWPRLAARFAAKEAVMKALGTGWSQGVDFPDIVVAGAPGEPPRVELRGEAARRAAGATVHLSLSHAGGMAVAFVVIERPAPA